MDIVFKDGKFATDNEYLQDVLSKSVFCKKDKFPYGWRMLENDGQFVSCIIFNNRDHTVAFTIEKGLQVENLSLTMEACEEAGIINLNNLSKIFKK